MAALNQTVLFFKEYLEQNCGIVTTVEEAQDLLKQMMDELQSKSKRVN